MPRHESFPPRLPEQTVQREEMILNQYTLALPSAVLRSRSLLLISVTLSPGTTVVKCNSDAMGTKTSRANSGPSQNGYRNAFCKYKFSKHIPIGSSHCRSRSAICRNASHVCSRYSPTGVLRGENESARDVYEENARGAHRW